MLGEKKNVILHPKLTEYQLRNKPMSKSIIKLQNLYTGEDNTFCTSDESTPRKRAATATGLLALDMTRFFFGLSSPSSFIPACLAASLPCDAYEE